MGIHVLDKKTVDQIAAGEVIERPSSVVKELVENAIDAGSDAVTVEVKNGGADLIRVTDNGCGIPEDEIRTAFLPHATSKIGSAEDLQMIRSLGFRGEALPSIAAVTRLEMITKTEKELTGSSFTIEGGEEKGLTAIGAPNGTTFLVKDIFYNVPARKKFLKTAMTETSYIGTLIEHMALSHPEVSLRFIAGGQTKLQTSGNGKVQDLIYTIYGRETAKAVFPFSYEDDTMKLHGYLGKPVISKGNRAYENYFINGRYVRSKILDKAIEEAYRPYMMQHRYPFCVLYIDMPASDFDVNVHPTKMELRFRNEAALYDTVMKAMSSALHREEFIPDALQGSEEEKEKKIYRVPEPFEKERIREDTAKYGQPADPKDPQPKKADTGEENSTPTSAPVLRQGRKSFQHQEETEAPELGEKHVELKPEPVPTHTEKAPEEPQDEIRALFKKLEEKYNKKEAASSVRNSSVPENQKRDEQIFTASGVNDLKKVAEEKPVITCEVKTPEQTELLSQRLISDEGMKRHRLIGQVFDTYWLIQMDERLYILDQHAAHEKVLYERKMKELSERKPISQNLYPPIVVSLTSAEELVLSKYREAFTDFGYEIEPFGGKEYAISAVPDDLYGLNVKELFTEILAEMAEGTNDAPEMIRDRLATASCKAAVKGNDRLSFVEAEKLLSELLTLNNPYACPHGRPTMISMTRKELEKRFKRIV